MKLTVSQVAALIGKTAYTIKRWYEWYEQLTSDELINYIKKRYARITKV